MLRIRSHGVLSIVTALTLLIASCTTDPYTGERQASKTAVGAGVGAAVGALGGAIVGGSNTRKAALIGAGVGALAGGVVGAYMDAQEAKLRKQLEGTGVSVTRQGDTIILNMPSNVTFDIDSAAIRPQFHDVLDSVAVVLKEYDKTYVDVLGHTDSTGPEEYNLRLSMDRAETVASYLGSRGVAGQRMVMRGLGESMPIASNDTADGRALNRRVEIALVPVT